jgi:hypothetical protein
MSHKYLPDASPFSTGAFARLLGLWLGAQSAASYCWHIDIEALDRLPADERPSRHASS